MNNKEPIIDPLDEQEQTLARIVRALPASEPSAALDARILKAATNAVAASPGRRLRWFSHHWAIGSAAAAILAIGISWQMLNPTLQSPDMKATTPQAPAASTASNVIAAEQFKSDALRSDKLPESPAAMTDAQMPHRDRQSINDAAQPIATTAAAAPPPPTLISPSLSPQQIYDEPSAIHRSETLGLVGNENSASARATPTPVTAAAPERHESSDQFAGFAAQTKRNQIKTQMAEKSTSAPLSAETDAAAKQMETETKISAEHRVQADSKLTPELWLPKIRERLTAGDMLGARASLRLLIAKYPNQSVPDDLKKLLNE